MKVQLLSDLHVVNYQREGRDWWRDELLPSIQTDADVLVLAGDCFSLAPRALTATRAYLAEICSRLGPKVLYVPGNHEFYGTSISAGMMELRNIEARTFNLTVLCPGKTAVIGDKRFLGGVGFQPAPKKFTEPISDHSCILGFDDDAPQVYAETLAWLKGQVRPGDVVVTHHAPNVGSLAPQWADSPINHWFISPGFTEVIENNRPSFWLHGHTHTPFRYRVGDTEVLCNPVGYPGERVRVNPKLVFEV